MASRLRTRAILITLVTLGLVAWVAFNQLVEMGAGALLHPARTVARQARPDGARTDDRETPPDHSQRVYAALTGPKRLILVPGAGHNQSLSRDSTWKEIEAWIAGP